MNDVMQMRVFGGTNKPNTIIGGVASTIPTRAALATKLGISESLITRFKVVGNDIQCKIIDNYTIPSNCFLNDTSITSYLDKQGKVTNVNNYSFENTSNLKEISFINAVYFGQGVFKNSGLLEVLQPLPAVSLNNTFENCSDLISVNAGLANGTWLNSFANCNNLTEVIGGAPTKFQGTFWGTKITSWEDSTTLECTQYAFRNCRAETVKLHACTKLNNSTFNHSSASGGLYLKEVHLPECTEMSYAEFRYCSELEILDAKKCKTFTHATITPFATVGSYTNFKAGAIVKLHEDLATSDGGFPHPYLVTLKNEGKVTIEFYNDAGVLTSTL